MQHQEKYTLRWHSYSDHLREALHEMMLSSEFADVTLVTDDKQQIRAHRNILSACSPVFKSILQIDSNKANPVIYLRGIQQFEMESIMQFIYLGEARFYKERLSEFLKVSKDLEIKDLSSGIEMMDQNDSNEEETNEHENNAEKDVPPQTENENCADDDYHTETSNTPIIRNKVGNKKFKRTEDLQYLCDQCDKQFTQQGSLSRHIHSAHESVKYACNQCDYQATRQDHLTIHIQSAHEGAKYACDQCDYQATQQRNLIRHIQSIHEGVKYACNQCDYQGSSDALYMHMKTKHF